MKTFRHYLAESVRTYNYKIKVAGTPDKNWLDLFCMNLQKFDPVKISAPKSTPIQKDPYGFPGLENEAITIIDVEFRYPATEPMVKQLARLQNYDENKVRMIQSNFDDSINAEDEMYANQMKNSPVLTHEELEDNGKQANKEYGEQYLPKIKQEAEKDKTEFTVAGGKTPQAFDPFKPNTQNTGNKSPMTTVKRPPLPQTGAKRGG
jgi:hypothetical protein